MKEVWLILEIICAGGLLISIVAIAGEMKSRGRGKTKSSGKFVLLYFISMALLIAMVAFTFLAANAGL